MLLGGGLTVSEPVTLPFLPELNEPLALTGPLTVVLFCALGLPRRQAREQRPFE
jgi:hypothetical protein